jgi:hypothetical protein
MALPNTAAPWALNHFSSLPIIPWSYTDNVEQTSSIRPHIPFSLPIEPYDKELSVLMCDLFKSNPELHLHAKGVLAMLYSQTKAPYWVALASIFSEMKKPPLSCSPVEFDALHMLEAFPSKISVYYYITALWGLQDTVVIDLAKRVHAAATIKKEVQSLFFLFCHILLCA